MQVSTWHRGGVPPEVDLAVARQAFVESGLTVPDVRVDARPLRQHMSDVRAAPEVGHTGYHPEKFRKNVAHASFPWVLLSETRPRVTVGVYCKQGEERSVGFAALLAGALELHGWTVIMDHCCSFLWRHAVCRRHGPCRQCDEPHPTATRAKARTAELMAEYGFPQAGSAQVA